MEDFKRCLAVLALLVLGFVMSIVISTVCVIVSPTLMTMIGMIIFR